MITYQDVHNAFVNESGWPRSESVPIALFKQWAAESDLEVRGALHHFLRHNPKYPKIDPPLSVQQEFYFFTTYFKDCFAVPRDFADESDHILAGFDLWHALSYWVADFWRALPQGSCLRSDLAEWLKDMCIQHDEIAVSVSDHVFGHQKIRKSFAGWAADPALAQLFPELRQ